MEFRQPVDNYARTGIFSKPAAKSPAPATTHRDLLRCGRAPFQGARIPPWRTESALQDLRERGAGSRSSDTSMKRQAA